MQAALPGRDLSSPALRGMIVRDMCRTPSNWRSSRSVPEYLEEWGVVAIECVDTRALVQHLRDHGSQMGIISTETLDLGVLADRLAAAPQLVGENLVKTVSCGSVHPFGAADLHDARSFALDAPSTGEKAYDVVAYDCGIKRGILEGLVRVGCNLTVVPWDTPAEDVLALNPDGVFLSNGPGDPDAVPQTYMPVSYTHLDVYKRQGRFRFTARERGPHCLRPRRVPGRSTPSASYRSRAAIAPRSCPSRSRARRSAFMTCDAVSGCTPGSR